MAKRKKDREACLTRQQIMKKYGISKRLILAHFPKPEIRHTRGRGGSWWTMEVWTESQAEQAMQHPEIQRILREREEKYGSPVGNTGNELPEDIPQELLFLLGNLSVSGLDLG